MAEQAKVTSLDALERFRSDVIVFLSRARQALDQVREDVHRTRQWALVDQLSHWENQLRKRNRMLDLAEQELFSARLSSLKDNKSAQEMEVRKWKRAVEEAEGKLRNIKRWGRDFDQVLPPLVKKLESLREILEVEMPKGVISLSQMQRILEEYSSTPAPGALPPPISSEGSVEISAP